jgi:hypothetical protein
MLPMSTSFRDALGILFPRLLIHKLEEGPKNPTHPSVKALGSLLSNEGDSRLRLTPFHATAILGILTKEEWGDAGLELRVRLSCILDAESSRLIVQGSYVHVFVQASRSVGWCGFAGCQGLFRGESVVWGLGGGREICGGVTSR